MPTSDPEGKLRHTAAKRGYQSPEALWAPASGCAPVGRLILPQPSRSVTVMGWLPPGAAGAPVGCEKPTQRPVSGKTSPPGTDNKRIPPHTPPPHLASSSGRARGKGNLPLRGKGPLPGRRPRPRCGRRGQRCGGARTPLALSHPPQLPAAPGSGRLLAGSARRPFPA